jgi:O-antigen chain-terminating methyltransferase
MLEFVCGEGAGRKSLMTGRIKRFIRKIPLIGYLAWWVYAVFRLPSKIKAMSNEMAGLKEEVRELGVKVIKNTEQWAETKKIIQNIDQLTNVGLDTDNVLITKGQIDSNSYLSRALESCTSSLHEMTSKNKDEDVFYSLLENLFRGSTEDIKVRQSIYLPYITEVMPNSKGKYFLDLGCGRGEFLSLLQEHGIPAKGVDTRRMMNELLKQKGLDITQSDALEFLQGLKDNLLIGLSMFQVIEHLDFRYVNDVLKAASHKISKAGIIILESVNPNCPKAAGNFYIDPTHVRLYSPDTIKLMLEWHGFGNIRIIYSSPINKKLRFKEAMMNYQDYAVIGEKLSCD